MKYKYRSLSNNSRSLLSGREIYFSNPEGLNDPYDCQLNILDALEDAIRVSKKQLDHNAAKKLTKFVSSPQLLKKIESDLKGAGIFSLSRDNNNALMWSHYSDDHRGFCIGFDLYKRFGVYDARNKVIGASSVLYYRRNPYIKFFREFFKNEINGSYNDFWQEALVIGLISKSFPWRYEREERIIRGEPGAVSFEPTEIREIIFGLRTNKDDEDEIRSLLSANDFSHVRYKRIIRRGAGFKFHVVDIK